MLYPYANQMLRQTAGSIETQDKFMKIFILDDSPIIRERLKRLIAEIPGIQVSGEGGDVRQATAAILEQKPDVLILDIHLLNGSGIDVLENVKKVYPTLIVIILTNYPFPQYRTKCMEAGADFFFLKSSEFDQVVPVLKQLVARTPDTVRRLSKKDKHGQSSIGLSIARVRVLFERAVAVCSSERRCLW